MEDLKDIPINQYTRLASFDIANMYSNIPTDKMISIIKFISLQQNVDQKLMEELILMTHTIMEQNYFEFQNKFCTTNTGLTMGAPTSSVLSEIYLQFMEHTQFYTTLILNNVLGYFRYGNDILIIYNESSTNTDTLLDCFNNAMPATTFSIEKEPDNSINFLDITVHKKARNFSFSIYQKPTTTDTIIPNDSCHPHEHKYAAIHYMVNRMNNYQLSRSSKEHESNIIRQIMYNNKYDPSHQNIRKTKHTIKQDKDNTQKWAKFTYIGRDKIHHQVI